MSKELSPELQAQIEQEALDLTTEVSSRSDYYIEGIGNGYQIGATKYALLLQSEQEKRKEAEVVMEKMAKDLELIVKWCNAADIKAVAIDNPIHMAVYHSLHQSMQSLTEYLKFKAKKDGQ